MKSVGMAGINGSDSSPGCGLDGSQRLDSHASFHQFSFNPSVKHAQYIWYPILARSLGGADQCIHEQVPDSEILIVTEHNSRTLALLPSQPGVRGYVVKSRISVDLIQAVEAASKHQPVSNIAPPSKSLMLLLPLLLEDCGCQ